MILQTTIDNVEKLTVKQLEVVIWAYAKRLESEWRSTLSMENEVFLRQAFEKLLDVLKARSASMKPRGVAFATQAVSKIVDFTSVDQ